MLALYISEALDCDKSRVFSVDNTISIPMTEMVFGESRAVKLYIVDGQGGYDAVSGAVGTTVKVGIGDLNADDPVWLNTSWTRIANGWQGVIAPNIQAVYNLFAGQNFITVSLRIQIIDAAGDKENYALLPFRLWRLGISTTILPTPPEDAQSGYFPIPNAADFVTVTGLNLSAVPRGVMPFMVKPAGGFNIFPTLVNGTITTDGFTVDFNGSTDSNQYQLFYFLTF